MTVSERIIEKFGGVRPMAAALGKPSSTVFRWKLSGVIPLKHIEAVIAAAKARGVTLEHSDFIPPGPGTPAPDVVDPAAEHGDKPEAA
jgi:hypothetical protein